MSIASDVNVQWYSLGVPFCCLYCRSCPSPWRPARGSGDGLDLRLWPYYNLYFAVSISVYCICIVYWFCCSSCWLRKIYEHIRKSWNSTTGERMILAWPIVEQTINDPTLRECWGPSLVWPGSNRNALDDSAVDSRPIAAAVSARQHGTGLSPGGRGEVWRTTGDVP